MGNGGYLRRYPCHVVFLLKGRIGFSLLFRVVSLVHDHFVNTVTLTVPLFYRFPIARRKNARRRVLIREMEALGERGVVVGSLESLKQTNTRETTKLAALTDLIAESLAGIHEKERHMAKMDLND
ncbi:hypothetical protein Tco_0013153 [Tanacetum coccineum]